MKRVLSVILSIITVFCLTLPASATGGEKPEGPDATLPHLFTHKIAPEIAPTCTKDGRTAVYRCDHCYETEGGDVIKAWGHSFEKEASSTDATCETGGFDSLLCSVCGKRQIEVTDPDETKHEKETVGKKQATWPESGYTGDVICLICNKTLEQGNAILPSHKTGDADNDSTVSVADARLILRAAIGMNEITAAAIGWCDIDSDLKITVSDARLALRCAIALDKINEKVMGVVTKQDSTCTKNGYITLTDGRDEKTVIIPVAAHDYNEKVTSPPTCTEKGVLTKTCAACGKTLESKIAATGHTASNEKTCTKDSVCSACGEVLQKATGHDYAPATCLTPKTCKICGAKSGNSEGHSYAPATCVTPATCTKCGATYGTANGGHTYAPATCTSPAKCTKCGATTGTPTAHTYAPATCTTPAKCTKCGTTTGSPTAHSMAPATYEKASTCTKCGYQTGYPLGVSFSSKGYRITTTKEGYTYVDGILIVNKTYTVPSTYNPGGLTAATQAAFNAMKSDAEKQGINLWVQSGFRSYSTQSGLYNRYVSRDGKAAADRYSARPGHSEHQTGLGIDVNSVESSFANTKEGKWLAAHCAEYGFIIRYPKGKEDKTGYMYEPWHIRYVGSPELAQKITNSGLCLEEYYGITSAYAQ